MSDLTIVSAKAIGVTINLRILEDGDPVDISTATVKQIRLTTPSGKIKTFAAEFATNGTDGRLKYLTTATTDIPEAGAYSLRAYLEMTGYTGLTDSVDGFVAE